MRFLALSLLPTSLLMSHVMASPLSAQRGNPQAPGYHLVSAPTTAGSGEPRETRVLLETAHLKLASITLRNGAVLEEHSAPMPVTIQVLSGRGTIELAGKTESVAVGAVLALSPGMKHLVRPDAGTDMILLVHHMLTSPRGPRPSSTPEQAEHRPARP
jgi:quercetin dioxygenase-like cupin family protein